LFAVGDLLRQDGLIPRTDGAKTAKQEPDCDYTNKYQYAD
jgi:hypothetical protein